MKIITISREFGSGGREVAKRLSDILGIAYYDSEIIAEIANKSQLDKNYVASTLEKGVQFNIPLHFGRSLSYIPTTNIATDLLVEQSNVIKEIAQKGDCIIVGRAADVILKEYNPFRIFVYADMPSKIERCQKRAPEGENLTDKQMEKKIRQMDKGRSDNYNLLSLSRWGEKTNYDLCVNTSNADIKEITPMIAEYAKLWFKDRE